ncbi:MAG: AAA family ATPase [Patescibacteria group bacterium]|nr:AAA family ATPase [Patescibacteria group bacterium]
MIIKFKDLKKLQKEKTVYTAGCFDILHQGHLNHFQIVKGNFPNHKLVVGILPDKKVKKLKGVGRPILSEKERARIVDSLKYVDYVFVCPFSEESITFQVIKKMQGDYVVVEERWRPFERDFNKIGAKFFYKKRYPYQASSKIIRKIREEGQVEKFILKITKNKKPDKKPLAIMLYGLSASGKTTVANILEKELGFVALGRLSMEGFFDIPMSVDYERALGKIRRLVTEKILANNFSIILDFCHLKPKTREIYRKICQKYNIPIILVMVICDPIDLKERLKKREETIDDYPLKFSNIKFQEKILGFDDDAVIVNTSKDLKPQIGKVLEKIAELNELIKV